jgi:hypothetical protein
LQEHIESPEDQSRIPISGCLPSMEDLVTGLRENGLGVDHKDYLRYRHPLMQEFQAKSRPAIKDFLTRQVD